jgi:hypothetical protein
MSARCDAIMYMPECAECVFVLVRLCLADAHSPFVSHEGRLEHLSGAGLEGDQHLGEDIN